MRPTRPALTLAVAALGLLAGGAFAQSPAPAPAQSPQPQPGPQNMGGGGNWIAFNKLSDKTVVDAAGEELGEIEDMVITPDGTQAQIVLELEDEDRQVLVDAALLRPTGKRTEYLLEGMDARRLAELPAFDPEADLIALGKDH